MIRALALAATLTTSAPVRHATHVACIGDSITAGYGVQFPAQAYPARLALMLPGVQVQAFGAPSTTAAKYGPDSYWDSAEFAAAEAWIQDAGATPVDIVILLGTNDAVSQGFTPEAFAADYEALVAHFEALTPDPRVFVLFPPPSIWLTVVQDTIVPLLDPIALQPGRVRVDVYGAFVSRPWMLGPDGTHPSAEGHAMIARLVFNAMGGAL